MTIVEIAEQLRVKKEQDIEISGGQDIGKNEYLYGIFQMENLNTCKRGEVTHAGDFCFAFFVISLWEGF